MSRESKMVVIRRDTEGKPTVWCDPDIADLVEALQDIGTVASCSGHGLRPGIITLKDARTLMIFDNMDHAKPANDAYPLDINGELVEEVEMVADFQNRMIGFPVDLWKRIKAALLNSKTVDN